MGKISDALKKVMEEREKQKQPQTTQVAVTAQAVKEPMAPGPVATPQEQAKSPRKKFDLEELFKQKQNFYIVKATDNSGIDPRIVTYFDYYSPMSEQYRILRTNIKSYLTKSAFSNKLLATKSIASTRVITISSSLPGEGKTITAINLATSLTHDLDTKVLLVDCDLRKGSVHKSLNASAKPGLSEILAQDIDYKTAIHPTQINNLFIMPAGTTTVNSSELFGSRKMRAVIEKIKSEPFNYIIFDTPPLLPFTDAGVLGAQTDGVILVVQAHKTPSQSVKKAREMLEQAHAKLLGFVLAQADYYMPHLYGYYSYYYKQKNNSKEAQ